MENSIISLMFQSVFPKQMTDIYTNPSSTLTIFRCLPSYCQHIILKLLFIEDKIDLTEKYFAETLCVTTSNQELSQLTSYFSILIRLKIFLDRQKQINIEVTNNNTNDNMSIYENSTRPNSRLNYSNNVNNNDLNLNTNTNNQQTSTIEKVYVLDPKFKQNLLEYLSTDYNSKEFIPVISDEEIYNSLNQNYNSITELNFKSKKSISNDTNNNSNNCNNNNNNSSTINTFNSISISKNKESASKSKSGEELFQEGVKKLDKFIEELIKQEGVEVYTSNLINFLVKSRYLLEERNYFRLGQITLSLLLENKQKILENLIKKYMFYLNTDKSQNLSINFAFLLFEMNLLEVGRFYKLNEELINKYSEDTIIILNHLGLVKYHKKKNCFCVTPLVNALFKPNLLLTTVDKMFYVETNFRIYIYSSKVTNKAILYILNKLVSMYEFEFEDDCSLSTDYSNNNVDENKEIRSINKSTNKSNNKSQKDKSNIQSESQSLLVGDLKRSALIELIKRGLTSEQIISFLKTYSKNGVVENIEQQIKMWEREVNIIVPQRSIFLYDFETQEDYKKFINKTTEAKIDCLWKNDNARACCFSIKYEEHIKRMLK